MNTSRVHILFGSAALGREKVEGLCLCSVSERLETSKGIVIAF